MATTTYFGITKPTVGGSSDSWGTENNAALDSFDDKASLGCFNYVIDGGGAVITTGIKPDVMVPYGFTITQVDALGDQSGSIVVDVWKDTYANFPPTDADSITASAPITISSATKSTDSTLTGWTTTVAADSVLRFNVDSCSAITRLTIRVKFRRT